MMPNGNLTYDGTNTYSWDARNHLTGISGGVSASFVYDPFGRRAEKVISGTTGTATQFLYDGLNPLQELDGASPPNITANPLTSLNLDEYFTRTDSSGTATFLSDALGSTIGLTNSSRAIATSYTYDPVHRPRKMTAPASITTAFAITAPCTRDSLGKIQ